MQKMTIAELNTPLERKRMIEYGADGCKVVRHWREVRHAVGNVWITAPENDEYGEPRFSTFLVFPEASDGIMLERELNGAEWRTLEDMEKRNMTLSEFLLNIDNRETTGKFIGNAQIEFVRQFDRERAEKYALARAAYYARKEAEEQARREQRAAEEAEKEEERKRIDAEARALYRGWADKMTAMQFGKMDNTLSAKVREDGKITTKREWIENKISDGWRPMRKDGVVTWYGSRWNVKESKPKTEYRLQREGTAEFYRISKTEHDYAAYLAAIA